MANYQSIYTGAEIDERLGLAENAQPKEAGKGLSTNDYTNTDKAAVGSIADKAPKAFRVKFSTSDEGTTWTADKTFAQIEAAIAAGATVSGYSEDLSGVEFVVATYMPLSGIFFTACLVSGTNLVSYAFTILAGDNPGDPDEITFDNIVKAWANFQEKIDSSHKLPASLVSGLPAVINNLTSDSTTDALSAAQGKALQQSKANTSDLATKEDVSNKETTIGADSNTKYPSVTAVKNFVNSSIQTSTAEFKGSYDLTGSGDFYLFDGEVSSATKTPILGWLGEVFAHSGNNGQFYAAKVGASHKIYLEDAVILTGSGSFNLTDGSNTITLTLVEGEGSAMVIKVSKADANKIQSAMSRPASTDYDGGILNAFSWNNPGFQSIDDNDYALVFCEVNGSNAYRRYKVSKISGQFVWMWEFDINSTAFTAAQLAALNSGADATKIAAIAGKYEKPSGGIPATDMTEAVQTSLGKADTAIQSHQDISGKEDTSNKVTSLSSASTDVQYPSAKCVYDLVHGGSTTLDAPMVGGKQYVLGSRSSLALTLPASGVYNDTICVVFTASAAFTPTISGTYGGETPYATISGKTYEYLFAWNGTKWILSTLYY